MTTIKAATQAFKARLSALRVSRRVKTAGWWGTAPVDGDTPLDLLALVGKQSPQKAALTIQKLLRSKAFADRYAALGVWDVVMASKHTAYQDTFRTLTDLVSMAARKGVPRDDDWAEDPEVKMYLRLYAQGLPSGKPAIRSQVRHFRPTQGGPSWYINSAKVYDYVGTVLIRCELINQFTGESKWVEENVGYDNTTTFEDNISTEIYGGKGNKQQSVVLTAVDDEGGEWEVQVEVDSETGEFDSNLGEFEKV